MTFAYLNGHEYHIDDDLRLGRDEARSSRRFARRVEYARDAIRFSQQRAVDDGEAEAHLRHEKRRAKIYINRVPRREYITQRMCDVTH